MREKVESIKRLKAMGLNMHKTVISEDVEEIEAIAKSWQRFSIRTDGLHRLRDMPFFMQKEYLDKTGDADLKKFLKQGMQDDLCFIIADGIKHDDIQLYNGVARISPNADFSLEMCTAKVPLRKMYGYPTFNLTGNLADGLRSCSMLGDVQISPKSLMRDLLDLYGLQIWGKYIEFTKYPVPVGEGASPYVFWEVR